MTETSEKIIEKAIEVFCRYGVRRTTMGDIAEHADVSRQTLYANFASKDEILQTAIQSVISLTVAKIQASWNEQDTIADKLESYLEIAVVQHFETISQMPDSKDLQTGFNESGIAAMKKGEMTKEKMLAKEFEPFSARLKKHGTSAAALAAFFESTSSGLKYNAENITHLKSLLHSLKISTLVLLGETT